jgi:diguanylate cyclase (GGDEF)-like protein
VTLLRQLSLAMFVLVLAVVAGSLAINVRGTRAYLEAQLASHAQDAATSLGVSLSTAAGAADAAMVAVLADAVFDRGAYRRLAVTDAQGRTLHAREVAPAPAQVPGWFAALLPLRARPGEAAIMDGWTQAGTVEIESHAGPAYLELWRSTRESVVLFAAAGAGALLLAWLLVGAILRPLALVEGQAQAIARRDFRPVGRLPATRELRHVVQAMNALAGKVRGMLDEQIALTEQARAQAYRDAVTGLANRARFNSELEQLAGDPERPPGALALVQIGALAEINARAGYGAGDALLAAAGPALARVAEAYELRCAARLGGGDFALLVGTADPRALERLGSELAAALGTLHAGGVAPEADVGHLGIAVHQPGETPRALLARADRAMRTAQASRANGYELVLGAGPALGAQDAAGALRDALAQGRLVLHGQPVLSLREAGRVLHYEVLARLDTADGLLPAGVFAPDAQRFGLAQTLDRAVVEAVLATYPGGARHPLALNLFPSCVRDAEFRDWLAAALRAHPALAARLSFEVSEYGAGHEPAAIEALASALRPLGVAIGLDHFGRGFQPFGYLASVRPAYLKVDGSHVRGVAHSAEGRFFMRALTDVAHALDGLLIGESVEHPDEQAALLALGADGAQGYHLAQPQPLHELLGG